MAGDETGKKNEMAGDKKGYWKVKNLLTKEPAICDV